MTTLDILSQEALTAIGWRYNDTFGTWANSYGGPVTVLPAVAKDAFLAEIIIADHFRSLGRRADGLGARFFDMYRSDMSAKEICQTAISALENRA